MKLKKTILGLAVVAVAGVNAWLANDVNAVAKNVISVLNLEYIADAGDYGDPENGGCEAGGPGAGSCSISKQIGGSAEVLGCGGSYTPAISCSVGDCDTKGGWFACCNVNVFTLQGDCHCRK